ncbi:hypothetical protein LZ32DRAFT_10432 [Colletotrichum eremochloae]|nr:hypothetical protein LZ32DRAFT_10432 [Colletotrichum eremochloae]
MAGQDPTRRLSVCLSVCLSQFVSSDRRQAQQRQEHEPAAHHSVSHAPQGALLAWVGCSVFYFSLGGRSRYVPTRHRRLACSSKPTVTDIVVGRMKGRSVQRNQNV